MLAKKARLSRAEFPRYFKRGKRLHCPAVTIIYTPEPATQRAAVVVGKKVAKQATVRNTIRRRLYAALQSFWKDTAAEGVWIIVAKPEIKAISRKQLAPTLYSEFGRALKGG